MKLSNKARRLIVNMAVSYHAYLEAGPNKPDSKEIWGRMLLEDAAELGISEEELGVLRSARFFISMREAA